MTRFLSALTVFALLTTGCAASRAQGPAKPSWTPPAQDRTYRTPEEASAAYETALKIAGGQAFRYAGDGHWQIMNGSEVAREVVIGGRADIDWAE